jgi:phage terminase large subunit-like protein
VRIIVPIPDERPWPTLGPELAYWIEENLVHGPGDMLGEPVQLTEELVEFLYRAYEVYPHDHEKAGRRRFRSADLSRCKGIGKTEFAAFVAIAELHPDAPVRCDGFRKVGREWEPVGRGVRDPYIPMAATAEEQVDLLAYGAAKAILQSDRCPIGNEFDVGEERITPIHAPGRLEAVSTAPASRDGARTTFQHFDETHLWIGDRMRKTYLTMHGNLNKRVMADPWELATTTMYGPGEESIAEEQHRNAVAILEGRLKDSATLFDHRQAVDRPMSTQKAVRTAVREAAGDAWPWINVDGIVDDYFNPLIPESRTRRYHMNQPRRLEERWMDPGSWDALAGGGGAPRDGERVVLMFDGSYARDCTAIIGATVSDRPHVFRVHVWETPDPTRPWRVPHLEVIEEVDRAMRRWKVAELACDPPGWHTEIEQWEHTYGTPPIVRFETNQPSKMGPACDEFWQAVFDKRLTHDGDPLVRRHLANCVEERRRGYRVVVKDSPDSPRKIDAAVGAIVATHRALWHASQPTMGEPGFAWG